MLFQLHNEVLRRLAVVAEVDVEHSGITRIIPQLNAIKEFKILIDIYTI